MKFTQEQLAKAKQAKSVEELLALAGENGIELNRDEAEKIFAGLHRESELSDEELDNVSGGCGDPDRYYKNQTCPDPDDFDPIEGRDSSDKRCMNCRHFARDNSDHDYGFCLA